MPYEGPDRRIHRVFVTRQTEYYTRRDQCVAVRDRDTGEWLAAHAALNRRITGVEVNGMGLPSSLGPPDVGKSLCFEGTFTVTSRVTAIERPPKDVVDDVYPHDVN